MSDFSTPAVLGETGLTVSRLGIGSSFTTDARVIEEAVEQVEREEIENALRVTDGNRTQAAKLLGINRRSLLRRLQKYGAPADEA